MTQRSAPLADMLGPRDSMRILWPLLALVLAVETLYSSRWLRPRDRFPLPTPPAAPSARPAEPPLRQLLDQQAGEAQQPLRVWFAPYRTHPESRVESTARSGFYDAFKTFPGRAGLLSNYGAPKLSAADGAFSMASAGGLGQELALARRLGYSLYALDLGALTDPAAATALCRSSAGCRLTADAYALFPVPAAPGGLDDALNRLQRRIPLLPFQMAGPSWRSLVFDPLAFTGRRISTVPGAPGSSVFSIEATPTAKLEIFRHPPEAYPAALRPWFKLRNEDVTLHLLPDTTAIALCIGEKPPGCQVVRLSGKQRSVAIGSLLIPGRLNRLSIVDLQLRSFGGNLFRIEVRSPSSFAADPAPGSAP